VARVQGGQDDPPGHSAYKRHADTARVFTAKATDERDHNRARRSVLPEAVPEVSGSTANKIRKQMRQFFTWTGRRNGAPRTPTRTTEQYTEESRGSAFSTRKEETALLAA